MTRARRLVTLSREVAMFFFLLEQDGSDERPSPNYGVGRRRLDTRRMEWLKNGKGGNERGNLTCGLLDLEQP